MIDRLHFLVVYVGSAAMAAFLAVCISSPRVSTFTCDTDAKTGAQRCELLDTLSTMTATADDFGDAAGSPTPPAVMLAEAH